MNQEELLNSLQETTQCACFNMRKATRHLTKFYDAKLSAAGMRSTQFSLLVHIAAINDISISVLADRMVMERTTLTRNLKPLEKAGYVRVQQGADKRMRTISLTDAGMRKLAEAVPYWIEAQAEFLKRFGSDKAKKMLLDMKNIESMAFNI
jgi:DNA-binding MarR family transcriptional regulator